MHKVNFTILVSMSDIHMWSHLSAVILITPDSFLTGISAKPTYCNVFDQHVARQQLNKHSTLRNNI
jgi:hypothetical protein